MDFWDDDDENVSLFDNKLDGPQTTSIVPLFVQLVPISIAIVFSKLFFSFAPPPLFPFPVPSAPLLVFLVLALAYLGGLAERR